MKRFTIVKLFLSLTILVLIPAFSRPDAARAQQSWKAVGSLPVCNPPCKLVCVVVDGKKVCACLCRPDPPID
jgi:hypothetical protein